MIAIAAREAEGGAVDKDEVASPAAPAAERWTRSGDYLGAMARRRTFRRKRERAGRTEPAAPRLLLSTIPFLVVIGALAVLAVSIMVADFPGSQPQVRQRASQQPELGTAPRGWFAEAEREMNR